MTDQATKAIENARKKVSSLFKRNQAFQGTGHRLGSTSNETPGPCAPPKETAPVTTAKATMRHGKGSSEGHAQPAANPPSAKHVPIPFGEARDSEGRCRDGHNSLDASGLQGVNVSKLKKADVLLESNSRLSPDALATLDTVLQNILKHPQEDRFRTLRRENRRVGAMLNHSGCAEVLQAVGFVESAEYWSLPRDQVVLDTISAGLQLVQRHQSRLTARLSQNCTNAVVSPLALRQNITNAEAPVATTSQETKKAQTRTGADASSTETSACGSGGMQRKTRVLLPTHTDAAVPDRVFDRTSADVKRDFIAARRKREESEVMMTRAQRERRRGARQHHSVASVRVRFPEGVVLQGNFGPQEPTLAIFAWVEAHLRAPLPFQLTSPVLHAKSKQLQRSGTVLSAGIMPAIVLNFRWADKSDAVEGDLCLSQAALRLVQAEELDADQSTSGDETPGCDK